MPNKINKKIGKIIKDSREKMGLSQQTVAEYIGVSKSAISRWESGQVDNMGRSKIQLLGELLNISPANIVLGEDAESSITYGVKKVPLLGSIACGDPILCTAEDNSSDVELSAL